MLDDITGVVREEREVAAYRHALSVLPESANGPRPWCRICHHEVVRWAWTQYAYGLWGVSALCHGEWCGGLLPLKVDRFYYRIELFCFDQPHFAEFPIWWVAFSGGEIQARQDYLDDAVRSGHEHPFLAGAFGKFARKSWAPVALGIGIFGWLFARYVF